MPKRILDKINSLFGEKKDVIYVIIMKFPNKQRFLS